MPSLTHPRQVIFVASRAKIEIMGNEVDKDDVIATTFHMPCSLNPREYCVSIPKKEFISGVIKISKVFSVNFVSIKMDKEAEILMNNSGEHFDKFLKAGIDKEECEKIDCSRLKDALGYLECEVINQVDTGDHIMFIGRVVNARLKKTDKRLFLKEHEEYTTTAD